MTAHTQSILALMIVFGTLGILIWRTFFSKKSTGCGKGCGCGAPEPKKLKKV